MVTLLNGPKQAWLDPAGSVPVYWDSFHIAGYQPHGRMQAYADRDTRGSTLPTTRVNSVTAVAPLKLGSVHHSLRVGCSQLPVTIGIVWV
jgi:hypothetical protein